MANHLGNVLVTVSDKRLVQDNYHYTLVGLGSDYSYNADLDAYYYTPGTGVYAQTSGADGELDWYTPDVLSYSDYYAFGAPQTGRNAGDGYRYGFNGKESDDEVKGVKGSHQDYGMRMYDPRVGRFFSADPLKMKYPYYTPYQFAGNMPIWAVDLDGLEPDPTQTTNQQDGNSDGIWVDYVYGEYRWYVPGQGWSYVFYPNMGGVDEIAWLNMKVEQYHNSQNLTDNSESDNQEDHDGANQKTGIKPSDMIKQPVNESTGTDQSAHFELNEYNYMRDGINARALWDSEMRHYYANRTDGYFGRFDYYLNQSEDWSHSYIAETYVGGGLKTVAFSSAPVGEGLGVLAEGLGITSSVIISGGFKTLAELGLTDGMTVATDDALTYAQEFLGPGYKELVPGSGRFISADGTRVVRMGTSDIMGAHGGGPHMNFETLIPNPAKPGKMMVDKNFHIFITN